MNDTAIVVPVKNPERAKERLADILSPSQRREFALALFRGVLDALRKATAPHTPVVMTDSDEVAEVARGYNAVILREERGRGETEAVSLATEWSLARDFRRQIVVPGDMAFLDPAEIDELLSLRFEGPHVVLCPATGNDGTNAVLTSPPNVIPFRFGSNSFPDYKARAKKKGVVCRVKRLKSFVLDVDTPEDLRRFLKMAPRCPAHSLLVKWGIEGKARR